jgi:hypothetical protein
MSSRTEIQGCSCLGTWEQELTHKSAQKAEFTVAENSVVLATWRPLHSAVASKLHSAFSPPRSLLGAQLMQNELDMQGHSPRNLRLPCQQVF